MVVVLAVFFFIFVANIGFEPYEQVCDLLVVECGLKGGDVLSQQDGFDELVVRERVRGGFAK